VLLWQAQLFFFKRVGSNLLTQDKRSAVSYFWWKALYWEEFDGLELDIDDSSRLSVGSLIPTKPSLVIDIFVMVFGVKIKTKPLVVLIRAIRNKWLNYSWPRWAKKSWTELCQKGRCRNINSATTPRSRSCIHQHFVRKTLWAHTIRRSFIDEWIANAVTALAKIAASDANHKRMIVRYAWEYKTSVKCSFLWACLDNSVVIWRCYIGLDSRIGITSLRLSQMQHAPKGFCWANWSLIWRLHGLIMHSLLCTISVASPMNELRCQRSKTSAWYGTSSAIKLGPIDQRGPFGYLVVWTFPHRGFSGSSVDMELCFSLRNSIAEWRL